MKTSINSRLSVLRKYRKPISRALCAVLIVAIAAFLVPWNSLRAQAANLNYEVDISGAAAGNGEYYNLTGTKNIYVTEGSTVTVKIDPSPNLIAESNLTITFPTGASNFISGFNKDYSASGIHTVELHIKDSIPADSSLTLPVYIIINNSSGTASDSASFSLKIIRATPVSSVAINEGDQELTVGGTADLTATVLPENATNKTVTWSSSDTSVATVNSSGKVTAVGAGPALITAAAGGITSDPITVTVSEAPAIEPELTFTPSSVVCDPGDTIRISFSIANADQFPGYSGIIRYNGGIFADRIVVPESGVKSDFVVFSEWNLSAQSNQITLKAKYPGSGKFTLDIDTGTFEFLYNSSDSTKPSYTIPMNTVNVDLVVRGEHHEAKGKTCTVPGNLEYWYYDGNYYNNERINDSTKVNESDVIIPAGHELTETGVNKAATCTERGSIKYWHCSVCGKNFSDSAAAHEISKTTIDPLGHDLKAHAAKAATCVKDGNIAYWVCQRDGCGKYFSDAAGTMEIDAADVVLSKDDAEHEFDESNPIITPPTADADGSIVFKCKEDASHPDKTIVIPKDIGYACPDEEYVLTSKKDITFTVKCSNSKFDKYIFSFFTPQTTLKINNKTLTYNTDYTAVSGSVKITLKSSYLEKLPAGKYPVEVVFTNTSAKGTLTVKKSGSSSGGSSTPGTGDDTRANNIVSGMILFIVSLSFIAYSLYTKKLSGAKLAAVFSGNGISGGDAFDGDTEDDGFEDIESDQTRFFDDFDGSDEI